MADSFLYRLPRAFTVAPAFFARGAAQHFLQIDALLIGDTGQHEKYIRHLPRRLVGISIECTERYNRTVRYDWLDQDLSSTIGVVQVHSGRPRVFEPEEEARNISVDLSPGQHNTARSLTPTG